MSTLEKVEEEVRRLLAVWRCGDSSEAKYKYEAYEELMSFLESLQEEPVSEDLMDAVNNYCVNVRKGYPRVKDETDRYICNAFEAGVQWQKEQMRFSVEAANQFIRDCTRTCSNETISGLYESWLTPEQAMRAVEIATGK